MTHGKKGILVVDDHPMMRGGIMRMIENQADLFVAGEAESGREAMRFIKDKLPDLVLLDLMLKHADGLATIKDLREHAPQLPILVYSLQDEESYAPRALKAGAMGYLMKNSTGPELLEALRTVLAGEIALSRKMYTRLCRTALDVVARPSDPIGQALTDRELHVFQLLGDDLGTREIAENLKLSIKTVETHRENIKKKLALADSVALIKAAKKWVDGPSRSQGEE